MGHDRAEGLIPDMGEREKKEPRRQKAKNVLLKEEKKEFTIT